MKLKNLITACAAIAVSSAGLALCSEAAVSPSTEWYLYIGGQEYIATQNLEGSGWSWNCETTTLTLEGYDSTAIYFDNFTTISDTEYTCPVFNIEVIGENSINNTTENQPSYGGSITDALSATGASINIKGDDKTTDKLNIFNEFSTDYSNTIYCFTFDENNETIESGSAISIDNIYLDIDTKSTHVIETSKFNTINATIEITTGICQYAIIDNYTYAENTYFDISMNVLENTPQPFIQTILLKLTTVTLMLNIRLTPATASKLYALQAAKCLMRKILPLKIAVLILIIQTIFRKKTMILH